MWLWTKPSSGWQNKELCERGRRRSQSLRAGGIRNKRPSSSGVWGRLVILASLMPWFTRLFGVTAFVDGFMQFHRGGRLSGGKEFTPKSRNIHPVEEGHKGGIGIFKMSMMNNDLYGEEEEAEGEEMSESDEAEVDDPEIINLGENEDSSAVRIDDLSWRVEKMRLEEANTRRFLKSRPRFLPYEECRKWVKAWNRWDSEEDWKRWIDEGKKNLQDFVTHDCTSELIKISKCFAVFKGKRGTHIYQQGQMNIMEG